MSDQTNIFGNEQGGDPSNQGTPSGGSGAPNDQALTDLLGQIKNERGEPKYKSVPDALTALSHAQNHIQTLLNEKRQADEELQNLRGQTSKLTELESTVQALIQKQGEAGQGTKTLSPDEIANLVSRTLADTQTKAQQTANQQLVATEVRKLYGEKASELFYGKGSEMGLSAEELNTLAAKSPQAVLKLLGVSAQAPNSGAPSSSTINADGFRPSQDSLVKRNDKPFVSGASSDDYVAELQNAKRMIEELNSAGMSVDDLANPKNYKKYFGK